MITGFEKETCNLNSIEKEIAEIVIKGLSKKNGEENAIKSNVIIRNMKDLGYSISGARLRKIINYIRINGIITNLVATSKGYYREYDQYKIQLYVKSLRERASAINEVANAISNMTIEEDGQTAIMFY